MYDMARWFGNFPVITREAGKITAENIKEVYPLYFPKANTPAEAYAQIISDLRSSLEFAPANNNADKSILSKNSCQSIADKSICRQNCSKSGQRHLFCQPGGCWRYNSCWQLQRFIRSERIRYRCKARNTSESILELQYFTGSGNWVTWMFGRDLLDFEFYFTWAKWVTPSRDLIKAFDDAGDTKSKTNQLCIIRLPGLIIMIPKAILSCTNADPM